MNTNASQAGIGPPLPGLSERPYFEDAELTQRLNLLQHLTRSSELLLLVLGLRDSGKTVLLDLLIERFDERWSTCRIQAIDSMDALRVLQQVAHCYDLPLDCGAEALYHLLMEQASTLDKGGRTPLILIDDGHVLTKDAVAAVARLAGAWHIVVFGEPQTEVQFRSVPEMESIGQHAIHLSPFSEHRAKAFLRHLCGGAEVSLSEEAIPRLLRDARGLPGRIRLALENETVAASATQSMAPQATGSKAPEVRTRSKLPVRLAAGIGAGALLAVVLLLQNEINALFGTTPASPESEPLALPLYEHPPQPQSAVLLDSPVRDGVVDETAEVVDEVTSEQPAVAEDREQTPPTPTVELIEPSLDLAEAVAVPDAPATEQSPEVPEPPARAETAQAGEPIADEPVVPQSVPETPAAEARVAVKPDADRAWILAQPPERLTVQVLASSQERTLTRAIERHKLTGCARYRVLLRDRDWYVLVCGSYGQRQAAQEAVRDLPEAVRKGQPWIRTFGEVQKEIQAGKK